MQHSDPAQPSDSTRRIAKKLAAVARAKYLRKQEEEYVLIQPEDIDQHDYVIQQHVPFNTNPYKPSELNAIIFQQYNLHFTHQESITAADNVIADVFLKKTQRIILFRTVKEYNYLDTEKYLSSLDDVLIHYKKSRAFDENDILVIPVAELARNHFRLLTIYGKEINYYDSKNYWVNVATRPLAPLVPASGLAYHEVEKNIQSKLHEIEMKCADDDREFALSTMEKIKLTSTALGTFAYHTVANYPSYFDHVKQVCAKHFPEHVFQQLPLGHQAYREHTNCGPFTAAYAEQVAIGRSPASVTEDPIVMRARYNGISLQDEQLDSSSVDTDVRQQVRSPSPVLR